MSPHFLSLETSEDGPEPVVGELEHPVRGHYTVHKKGDIHHVKNKFNDVARTFYNMPTQDVMDFMKTHHEMSHTGEKHE